MDDLLAYVGVDWASTTHYAYALDASGCKLGHRSFPHSGDGMVELANWIRTTTSCEPNRIAETPDLSVRSNTAWLRYRFIELRPAIRHRVYLRSRVDTS